MHREYESNLAIVSNLVEFLNNLALNGNTCLTKNNIDENKDMFDINNCGENMFPELIIVKKKGCILLVYCLPNTNKK